jgi:hypothetical protein
MSVGEPNSLPTLGDVIEAKLGFRLPTIALPQTVKNADKAFARLVLSGADNLVARINRSTEAISARSAADTKAISTAGNVAADAIETIEDRAEKFRIADSILKQKNRESIFSGAIE